jgi:hypothetical protein
MLYLPYGFSDSCLQFYLKNNNPKRPLYFSILPLLFHISFIHPISLPSSFGISPRSFLSLSHFATSIPHVFNCLSLLIAHSAPSFLSFRPLPGFSLLVPTSTLTIIFFFHLHSLSPSIPEFPHTPLILPVYLDSLIPALLSCLSVSLSLSRSSTFIHLPFALNLSTSSLAYPFLWSYFSVPFFSVFFFFSLQHSVSILHSSLFVLKLCRSLSRFHSQLITLVLFPHYATRRFSLLFPTHIPLPCLPSSLSP